MAPLKTANTAFFRLRASLASHFASHPRLGETAAPWTRYVSRLTPLYRGGLRRDVVG
jgi:hypothetical protein